MFSIQDYEISHYTLLFIFYKKIHILGNFKEEPFISVAMLQLRKLLLQPKHLLNEVIQLEHGEGRLLYGIYRENKIKLKCKSVHSASYFELGTV